jgi:hypothetical protein
MRGISWLAEDLLAFQKVGSLLLNILQNPLNKLKIVSNSYKIKKLEGE